MDALWMPFPVVTIIPTTFSKQEYIFMLVMVIFFFAEEGGGVRYSLYKRNLEFLEYSEFTTFITCNGLLSFGTFVAGCLERSERRFCW